MQRKAFAMKERRQLTVSHACIDRHGVRLRLQRNHFVDRPQGQKIICAICNIVEAVARSQYL